MENLSSDRMMAVRVFEGELERMKNITGGEYDQVQKIIRQYLQERINEMTGEEPKGDFQFNKNNVLFVIKTISQLANQYSEMTSSIIIPTQKGLLQ